MRKQWAKHYVQSGSGKFYDQRRWKLYRTLLRNGRQGEMSIEMGQGPLQRDVIAWMLFLFFFRRDSQSSFKSYYYTSDSL